MSSRWMPQKGQRDFGWVGVLGPDPWPTSDAEMMVVGKGMRHFSTEIFSEKAT
jgi:hypothetical protein